jgi:hypothetical protein
MRRQNIVRGAATPARKGGSWQNARRRGCGNRQLFAAGGGSEVFETWAFETWAFEAWAFKT